MQHQLAISVLCLLWLGVSGQTAYFPNGSFDDSNADVMMADWYAHELSVMNEPPLSKLSSVESYRFLWLRSLDAPIVIRLDVKADGSGVVTTKVADGQAGFPVTTTKVVQKTERPLRRDQVAEFVRLLDRTGFWSLPTNEDPMSTESGGSEWVIEAAKQGRYHVVARWSPDVNRLPGSREIFSLGMALAVNLAQVKMEKDKMY